MYLGIFLGSITFLVTICAFAWYRVVPPSQAHFVVTPNKRFVASADSSIGEKTTYFAIPPIPFIGRQVRVMDVTIKELIVKQETYEKGQARYRVSSSLKYRITDVVRAAETFVNDEELQKQLEEIVRASVRAITVKYNVVDARANKQTMSSEITKEIADDLKQWGLSLVNFVLVDFQDTEDSQIISNISRRREVEIESETRELNAEKIKQARVKEAVADQNAREQEIKRDEVVAMKEENKKQKISEQEKLAEEKRLEVTKVQEVTTAEIERQKQLIIARQQQEVEEINKERKRLEGEGDRDRAIQQAKGDAAPILERGLAEAQAKDALQEALNKFSDEAIRALVAEQIVDMQKQVGIETARALKNADVRLFAGGNSTQSGFDLGSIVSAASASNDSTAAAVINRLARPNDLGLAALGVSSEVQP